MSGILRTTHTNTEKYGNSAVEEPHYELPSAEALKEAGECLIMDEYGKKKPFKAIYEGKGGQHLIIFIRHFFCSSCEDYVRTLSEELPPAVLHSTTPATHLTIIGCGNFGPVAEYRVRTMNRKKLSSAICYWRMRFQHTDAGRITRRRHSLSHLLRSRPQALHRTWHDEQPGYRREEARVRQEGHAQFGRRRREEHGLEW